MCADIDSLFSLEETFSYLKVRETEELLKYFTFETRGRRLKPDTARQQQENQLGHVFKKLNEMYSQVQRRKASRSGTW